MKITATILSLALLFSCNSSSNKSGDNEMPDSTTDKASEMTNGASSAAAPEVASTYKKYDIKSGIVTFETKMEMSGMTIKIKKILYFDDYGIKESEEEYKTDEATGKEELTKRDFVKDGYRYICSVENKGGAKSEAVGYGVAAQFNMDEAATLKDNEFKKIADETIAGKTCNGFSMKTPSGNIKMYGWSRITLKTLLNNSSMKSETVATKLEENVPIPPDKFEVPEGVKMTDM